MTDKQPEALIRADELEAIGAESSLARAMAAHTIRLLYKEKAELVEFNDQLCAENDRLLEQRTELVEAVEAALSDDQPYIEKCKAALAKAQGETALQRLNKAAEDNGEEL